MITVILKTKILLLILDMIDAQILVLVGEY